MTLQHSVLQNSAVQEDLPAHNSEHKQTSELDWTV